MFNLVCDPATLVVARERIRTNRGSPFLQTYNPQNGGALARVAGLPNQPRKLTHAPHFIALSRKATSQQTVTNLMAGYT